MRAVYRGNTASAGEVLGGMGDEPKSPSQPKELQTITEILSTLAPYAAPEVRAESALLKAKRALGRIEELEAEAARLDRERPDRDQFSAIICSTLGILLRDPNAIRDAYDHAMNRFDLLADPDGDDIPF